MKKRILTFGIVCTALILGACGNSEAEKEPEKVDETCFYSFDDQSFEMTWTAYKTNAKVAVPGTFDEITVTGASGESPEEVIKSLEFEINTSTINSNNEERDAKIVEHFFGTINTPKITGKVKSVDSENGNATVTISMHNISFDVVGDFSMNSDSFSFDASIDVVNWNAMSGIQALNKVCFDLHKGDDGVSKLWSEVAISFKGHLNSEGCN